MKKLAVALFVALLGFAFTAPAFALENQFGGYWRVRMFNNTDFDGEDVSSDGDIQKADTRTRLYYTAKLNDNLKFVNKFEMDATWGTGGKSYGDIGADGVAVEVKNSYIEANLGSTTVKLGTQGATIQRGFIFSDDFSGLVVANGGFAFLYAKVTEGGENMSDDASLYHANYTFDMGDLKVKPNVTYADMANDDNIWHLGVDLDGNAGGFGYWATAIYNGGELGDADVSAFLIGAGVDVAISDMASIHGQIFHATGDEDAADDDAEAFITAGGESYYWAEIMGYGVFDDQVSNASCDDSVSNITAINLGISFNASEKLTLGADLWYALLAEEDANGEDELGTEIDLSAAYTITEGLRMHFVAAYLFAGDATTGGADDDANPFEIGTQFSISF